MPSFIERIRAARDAATSDQGPETDRGQEDQSQGQGGGQDRDQGSRSTRFAEMLNELQQKKRRTWR